MLRKIAALALILCTGAFLLLKMGKKESPATSFPVVEKKSFVIIIPTFNDAEKIQSTLFTAYEQHYDHFRILIIDDNSTDLTVQKAVECAGYFQAEDKTTLIQNQSYCGTLGSIYNAIHTCHDHEIALILLGGDRLASSDVLKKLNQAYANPETWMTCGSALDYPTYEKKKQSARLPSRTSPWNNPTPFSFYTTLFKEIPIDHLFYRGRFYTMGWEYAVGFPLLEMAVDHTQIITSPLYLADQTSKYRDHLIHPSFFKECEEHVRERPSLSPLSRLPSHPSLQGEMADLLIFSSDRPLELFALLESVDRHVLGIHQTTVFYESSSQPFEIGYLELKLQFPSVQFLKKDEAFKSQLMNTGFAPSYSSSPYVILATDGVVVCDLINMTQAIGTLEHTHAYGIYFDLHKELNFSSELNRYQCIPVTTPLPAVGPPQVGAWQLSWARDDWHHPGNLHFALYRKGDLAPLFAGIEFESPAELEKEWNLRSKESRVGLFYNQAKAICLKKPENPSGELEKFLGGLKLDLTSLFQVKASSREISLETNYIPRE